MARRFHLEASACLLAAAMLLVLPLKWLAAAVVAAGVHEACHYLALRLVKVDVYGVSVGGRGVVMRTGEMTPGQELVCALAGPVGGLLLLPFARWLPRVALIGLIHSVYNLLPLFPLDGGRALRSLCRMLFQESTAEKICRSAEVVCAAAVMVMGLYGALALRLGILGLGFVCFGLRMIGKRKEASRC